MNNIIDKKILNPIQLSAFSLIQEDMRFIYTLVNNRQMIHPTYWIELCPYLGIIIDGAEDWIKAFNNSSKNKINIPLFNSEEEHYYIELRNASKTWDYNLSQYTEVLSEKYEESEKYFSKVCKPFAQKMHLYNTIGVLNINGHVCGNTVLDACYIPDFKLGATNGEHIKNMFVIAGTYIALFGADKSFEIAKMTFSTRDYGGFNKIPFGKEFSIQHVLFSFLCVINFVLYGIDELIQEEISTKLRIGYICYFHLLKMLNQADREYGLNSSMSNKYTSQEFRNSMAHYKLGVALKENELVLEDPMKGLVQKFFNTDYYTLKEWIFAELKRCAEMLEEYLKI